MFRHVHMDVARAAFRLWRKEVLSIRSMRILRQRWRRRALIDARLFRRWKGIVLIRQVFNHWNLTTFSMRIWMWYHKMQYSLSTFVHRYSDTLAAKRRRNSALLPRTVEYEATAQILRTVNSYLIICCGRGLERFENLYILEACGGTQCLVKGPMSEVVRKTILGLPAPSSLGPPPQTSPLE